MDAVTGYSIAQVKAFMGAIERQRSREQVAAAVAARMAQAEGKAWKRYISALGAD